MKKLDIKSRIEIKAKNLSSSPKNNSSQRMSSPKNIINPKNKYEMPKNRQEIISSPKNYSITPIKPDDKSKKTNNLFVSLKNNRSLEKIESKEIAKTKGTQNN